MSIPPTHPPSLQNKPPTLPNVKHSRKATPTLKLPNLKNLLERVQPEFEGVM